MLVQKNSNVLVLHPGGIGDAILLIPLLTQLNKNGYNVDILCKNSAMQYIMQNVDSVRNAILFPWLKSSDLLTNKETKRMLKELKKNRYSVGLQPFQGRGIFSVLLMLLSGIKKRYHHTYRFKFLKETGLFLTDHIPFKEQHSLYNNIELAKLANLIDKDEIVDEKIEFNREKFTKQFNQLAQKYIGQNSKIVALYPGGGDNGQFEYKRWKYSYWLKLINLIKKSYPEYKIVMFLGPGEKEISNFFYKNKCDELIILNSLKLDEVISLLSGVSLFIGNDGGLSHIASIFEVNELVIYGPTDWRYIYPLNKNFKKILPKNYKPIFVPYKNLVADLSENKINTIKPDDVFKEVNTILDR